MMSLSLPFAQAAVVTLVLCAITLAIVYPDRCVGVASRLDLSGPKGLPFIGNLIQVWPYRRHMIKWMEEQAGVYGPLFTFTIPNWGRITVINRPEWLAHVKKSESQHSASIVKVYF